MQHIPTRVVWSRQLAQGLLRLMHKRLKEDPGHKANYVKFIQEYEELEHMSIVSARELHNEDAVFIPHQAATNEKFRAVSDGGCKMKDHTRPEGVHLNGEQPQNDFTFIIARFRLGKVGFSVDIPKVLRQVIVPRGKRDVQRIL